MNLTSNLVINLYSIAIILIIYFRLPKDDTDSPAFKIYVAIIHFTALLLIFDILARFDGNPGTIYEFINRTGNFLLYLITPVIPSLWLSYIYYQIFQKSAKLRKILFPLIVINLLSMIMLFVAQYYNLYYFIDSNNIYHRGPLYLVSVSFTFLLIISSFILTIKNKNKIERTHYFSLVFFPVPPIVCIILSLYLYGVSLIINGIVISLIIIFLDIQNKSIYTDYLTEIYNRKKLDIYLKNKIQNITEDTSFATILLDMNNFKSINDTHGHSVGDDALQTTVKLLKSCLSLNDFIARYGGDEFCIILDIEEMTELEKLVEKINKCVEKYNKSSNKPYEISFGVGYAIYDKNTNMKADDFLKLIDILMYTNKQGYKNVDDRNNNYD